MGIDTTVLRRATPVAVPLLAITLLASASVASAAGRVALVVGNSAYAAIGTLPNPGNDAADISSALGLLAIGLERVV